MNDFSTSIEDPRSRLSKIVLSRRVSPANNYIQFDKEEIDQSIPTRFEQQVKSYPDRLAVKTRSNKLTYDELNIAANGLSQVILSRLGEKRETVAILLEHDAPVASALLGVLKADKIYVPLDPSYPHDRNAYVLKTSEAKLIVTNEKNLSLAEKLSEKSCQVINLDDMDSNLSSENPGLDIPPDSIAYILFTSGSTGHPKGVVQNHRNVLHNVMKYTNGIRISKKDNLSLLPSYSFAASVSDIYGALLNGAALFPYNLKEEGLVNLSEWLIQEEITIYHSVPTVFRHFAKTLTENQKFPNLRLIKLGGEQVTKKDVELYKEKFSDNCILHIGLGATEMNIIRQYFIDKQINLDGGIVPVGYEVDDSNVVLLDNEGKELGFNRVGEIAIKSRYLAMGYWRNSELTKQKFLPDAHGRGERIYLTGDIGCMLEDGCLVHLGRKDFQVKIRGHRIEIAEVEGALLDYPAVIEAVVTAKEDNNRDKKLIGYLVVERDSIPPIRAVREFLRKKIPDYMVPSVFVLLDSLPLTASGKIDRTELPEPDLSKPSSEKIFIPPRTSLEIQIAKVWQELLGVYGVGLDDNFFDLGGNSLLLMEAIDEIEKLTGIRIDPIVMISQSLGELSSACLEILSVSQTSNQSTFKNKFRNTISSLASRIIDKGN